MDLVASFHAMFFAVLISTLTLRIFSIILNMAAKSKKKHADQKLMALLMLAP